MGVVDGLCRRGKESEGGGMMRVGVGTRAVARAKVPPVPVRKLRAAMPRQRKTRENRRVFDRPGQGLSHVKF